MQRSSGAVALALATLTLGALSACSGNSVPGSPSAAATDSQAAAASPSVTSPSVTSPASATKPATPSSTNAPGAVVTSRETTTRPAATGNGSLPAAMIGTWNTRAADCGTTSEGSLTVQPKRITFYEGGGAVTSVVREGGVVRVTMTLNAEGTTETRTYRFQTSADGQTLTDLTTQTVRHRCR